MAAWLRLEPPEACSRTYAPGAYDRFPHFVVACWIDEIGPCPQARLAEALDADASDLVSILVDLERHGFVARDRDSSDRRRVLTRLTDAGRTWLERRDAAVREYDADLCSRLVDGGATLRAELGRLLGLGSR